MGVAANVNRANWGVKAARGVLLPGTDYAAVVAHLGYLTALCVATAALASWSFPAHQRSL